MRAFHVVVILLCAACSANALASACDGFVDVDGTNAAYCTAVSYVKDHGITLGCSDSTHYCPNDYVTRLQMALFISRAGLADPSNTLGDHTSTMGGGTNNVATGSHSTVAGGDYGTANATYATVSGGSNNNAIAVASTVGGGKANTASSVYSTTSGGYENRTTGPYSTVGGGADNAAEDTYATVAGGYSNTVLAEFATIGGGYSNLLASNYSTISGGNGNSDQDIYATVAGGNTNSAGQFGAIGGGGNNFALGHYGTVPGGYGNSAAGNFSFAAGYVANADQNSCFVFADSSSTNPTTCNGAAGSFNVRAFGGVRLMTGSTAPNAYVGAQLASGSGSWTTFSDRAGKDAVQTIDPMDILARVSAMPVATWHYKTQDKSIRHMGPMAQDFYAAFNLGETDKGISVVDAQGVALAAIQGLNEKVETRDAVITEQARHIVAVEALVQAMAQQMAELRASMVR